MDGDGDGDGGVERKKGGGGHLGLLYRRWERPQRRGLCAE